jgi:hypothetical protein
MQTRIIQIDPRKARLLKVNARFMRHETFMRLTENIKKDGALSSVPFAAILDYYTAADPIPRDEEGQPIYEVLSGNHRVKAAIAAGLTQIDLMVTDDPLSADERKAKQLSHNELAGEDDPATLKLIYDSIDDVDMRLYSGLDDKRLELLEDVKPGSLSEANLEFQTVAMVFLPSELEQVEAVWEKTRDFLKGSKAVWVARWNEYDKFMTAMDQSSRSYGVKNVATTLMVILELFTRHLDELTEGFLDQAGEAVPSAGVYVPLETLLGDTNVPPKIAAVLKKSLDRIRQDKGLKENQRYQALQVLAQHYLDTLNNRAEQ